MAENNGPVLGAPVEPPEDVWLNALSGALDDPRSPEELGHLVPSDDELSPLSLDDVDQDDSGDADDQDDWSADPAEIDDDDTHDEPDHDAGDEPGESWDDPSSSG